MGGHDIEYRHPSQGLVAPLPDLSGAALGETSYACKRSHWRQGSIYRMLTRMPFGAGRPPANLEPAA